jgi:hypothetical protein
MKKAQTISLQGNDYAKVAERIKLFREDCPNGLIETTPTLDGKNIMFKARILKDKANEASAEATGHAVGENNGKKAFEKLESIAVGRALAMLGYMASGEIASSEEMEEFNSYKDERRIDAIADLQTCTTLEGLRVCYMGLGSLMGDPSIIAEKDKQKLTLQNENS